MIDLDPGDDLDLLVGTAGSFAREQLAPARREAESRRGVSAAVRGAFDRIGLAGLEVPTAHGGAGLGSLARVLVNEELGAADAGAALALDPFGPALHPLLELGGDDALERFVAPRLRGGDAKAVLVCEEDAPLEIEGDRASASVPWVPADRADLVVWLAKDGAVVVREGLELSPLPGAGLRAAGAAALSLRGAPIAARYPGAEGAARARARARLYVGSLLLGVLRHAAGYAREYAQERVAFGRPIAHHQGLAFLLVDMHTAVEGARLLLQEAAWRADVGLPFEEAAASAFCEVVEASRRVGPDGVQVLGGHGFMQDHPVEKAMRESRALGLWLGGPDAAREEAGRALAATTAPVCLSPGGVL